jgi:hypothetical protein
VPTTPDRLALPVFDIPARLHAKIGTYLIGADERCFAAVRYGLGQQIAGQGETVPGGVRYSRRT